MNWMLEKRKFSLSIGGKAVSIREAVGDRFGLPYFDSDHLARYQEYLDLRIGSGEERIANTSLICSNPNRGFVVSIREVLYWFSLYRLNPPNIEHAVRFALQTDIKRPVIFLHEPWIDEAGRAYSSVVYSGRIFPSLSEGCRWGACYLFAGIKQRVLTSLE